MSIEKTYTCIDLSAHSCNRVGLDILFVLFFVTNISEGTSSFISSVVIEFIQTWQVS
jgi:hypothetical protein